jgi:hypothetical protein
MAIAAPIIILGAGALALLAMSSKKSGSNITALPGENSGGITPQPGDILAPPGTPAAEKQTKAQGYQAEVIKALTLMGVNPETAEVTGTPSEESIQYGSGLVARMKADGFVVESQMMNAYVQKAIAKRPAAPTVVIPSIPANLQQELNNVVKYSKDPAKLREVAGALKKLPGAVSDPNIVNSIAMLEEMAAQIEAQLKNADAIQKIDVVINSPTAPITITTNKTDATSNPGTTINPAVPPPVPDAPPPAAKSPVETSADLMVAHLHRLQNTYGIPPKSKGKEDTNLVKKFQSLAKLTSPDGKAGPGTLAAAATAGQYNLPYVMYWPKSATSKKVLEYRATLNAIADKLEATNPSGARELRLSASRERGQAGIVGAMPA